MNKKGGRDKGRYARCVRHEDWGLRPCVLEVEGRRLRCLGCGRRFRQSFPGIQRWQRASEAFQTKIFRDHLDGINHSRLGRREGIGAVTVERYFRRGLERQFGEWHSPRCPRMMGIHEHFFTRRTGFATNICDLKKHKVYDVVLGRSKLSLQAYFQALEGKTEVELVCMNLASGYRALVKKYFPHARIVADRFHVIRIINHHFLACWREIDPAGSKNRGLISLPFGPGWRRVRVEAGVSEAEAAMHARSDNFPMAFAGWFAGCTVIWSALFTVGNFLYGQTNYALALLAAFVVSAMIVIEVVRRLWK